MKASSKEGGAPPYASTTFGVFGYPTQRGKSVATCKSPTSPDSQSLYPVTPPLDVGLFILPSNTKHNNQNNNCNYYQNEAISDFCKLAWV